MPHVCTIDRRAHVRIGREDDHVTLCGVEQTLHVLLEHDILDEVKDHIERKPEVGALACVLFHELELLRRVALKSFAASPHGFSTDVKTEIPRVVSKGELIAVAAAKLDHGLHSTLGDEAVHEPRLVDRELPVRAGSRVAPEQVPAVPVVS